MLIRFETLLSLVVLIAGPWTSSATAQGADTLNGPPQAPFFDRTDVVLAAGFVGGAVGLAFSDQQLAHAFQGPSMQGSATARKAAGFFEFMGQPGPEIIGVALYGVGRFIIDESVATPKSALRAATATPCVHRGTTCSLCEFCVLANVNCGCGKPLACRRGLIRRHGGARNVSAQEALRAPGHD